MTDEKLTYRIEEAIRVTGLSRSTFNRLIKAGKLATTRVGSRVLIPREALHALVGRAA